jgi:hypothetical protein
VRPDHADAEGQIVGINESFYVGGEYLDYPGDDKGSPEQTINCFAEDMDVSAVGVNKSYRRFYEGEMLTISTLNGSEIRVTPNHPALTPSGWVAAGKLNVGSHLVRALRGDCFIDGVIHPDVQNQPATFREVHGALLKSSIVQRVEGLPVNFHGDGRSSEVEIISADRFLRFGRDAELCEQFSQSSLALASSVRLALMGERAQAASLVSVGLPAPSAMCGDSVGASFFNGELTHASELRGRTVAARDAAFSETTDNDGPSYTEAQGNGILRLAGLVAADEIINIEVNSFRGFVHNLETSTHWYLVQGLFQSNCHCIAVALPPEGNTTASFNRLAHLPETTTHA